MGDGLERFDPKSPASRRQRLVVRFVSIVLLVAFGIYAVLIAAALVGRLLNG